MIQRSPASRRLPFASFLRIAPGLFRTFLLACAAVPGTSAPAATAQLASLQPPPAGPASGGRVVVLGFDGADAATAKALMDAGQLPNLSKLASEGTFAPLLTTNPAESPVSWSSLNTGQNPAKTGVPGFVVRDLGSSGSALPGIGFFRADPSVPVDSLKGAPLPTWSSTNFAAIAGLATFALFFVVLRLLMRIRTVAAVVLSLVLAGTAAWAGKRVRDYMPDKFPVVKNVLEATPFWEVASKAGVPSIVLDAAQAWDREDVPGAKVLAGLGVPDARGQYNGFSIYTSDPLWYATEPGKGSDTPSAGNKFRVHWRDGRIESRIWGPKDFWSEQKLTAQLADIKAKSTDPKTPFKAMVELAERQKTLESQLSKLGSDTLSVPLTVQRDGARAVVSIDGNEQTLEPGAWSDWYRLSFEINPLLQVHALTRAKLLSLDEPFKLYVDALQIDPERPPFWQPISQPSNFSRELARAAGPYETVGWACMNLPYKDGEVDPISFLQDIEFTFKWREKLTLERLGGKDWRLFFSCFSTPDRVQHMMYQFYDPTHPLYDAAAAAQKTTFFGEEIALSDAIPAIYRQVDRLIGEVRARLAPEDALVLCADHGFQSFRRQVHLNNWLVEKGYLALKSSLNRDNTRLVALCADWSKTKAYAIGLGTVYVNLKGRESQGIVESADVPALLASIQKDFLDTVDPETGKKIGRVAYVTKDIHQGPHLDREADLFLAFDAGYRVSWTTTSGGVEVEQGPDGPFVPTAAVTDNDKSWSGDHVSVDPHLVQGIFYCNRKLTLPEQGVDLRHVAPTVLSFLGVAVPPDCDLAPLKP